MTSIASNRARGRRLGAVVVAILTFVLTGGAFFYIALFGLIHTCSDTCGAAAGGWTHLKSSWVWSAQFWGLAAPALLAAVLFVWLIVVGRRRAAIFALAVVVGLTCGWLVLFAAGGHDFNGRYDVVAVCVVLQAVGGAIAVRIAPPKI